MHHRKLDVVYLFWIGGVRNSFKSVTNMFSKFDQLTGKGLKLKIFYKTGDKTLKMRWVIGLLKVTSNKINKKAGMLNMPAWNVS